MYCDVQDVVDDIRFQQGLQQLREHNRKQINIRNESIKKHNERVRKHQEAQKQKRVDANDEARRANEEHAKKLNETYYEEQEEPTLIIKRTKPQK